MANRKLIVEIVGDSRSLERSFKRAEGSAKGFSRTIGSTLRGLTALAAPTSVGFLAVDSLKRAATFEQTMQRIVGLSGVAQSAISGLTDEILKLAPAVGRGPQELAEGLQFITSSGVPAAKAMAVLDVSARAAASGLGETKTVADAVTSVMNAYGAANVSAARATDVLVATVREGKGEASDFAGVIGNVVSIASQLGVSFEDVGAALAAMTRLGTDAETSSTQLQQVFSNLVKVTPKAERAFKKVGLSTVGLRKQIAQKGLLSGLRTIREAFDGDIPGLAQAFGDIRALRGVLALVGNQAESTRGIFGRLNDSTGSLGDSFAAVSDTTAQKFARLNAAADTVRITVGAALAPAFEKAATAVTDWLSKTKNQKRIQRDLAAATQTVADVAKAFAEVLRTLRDILKPVVDLLGGTKNAVQLLLTVMVATKVASFATALTGVGTQATVAAGRVGGLRLALSRLALISAIAIPITVFLNRKQITEEFNKLTDSLPFGRGKEFKIDATTPLAELKKIREGFVLLEGEGSASVKKLDEAIRKLGKTRAKTAKNASTRDELLAPVRRALAPFTPQAAGGVNINGPITVVTNDPDEFVKKLQKKSGRSTASTRGRFSGRNLGLG